jgi:two-component system response regulator AlgR
VSDALPAPQALRVFIVDDEELARMRLSALVQANATPAARVVGEAADAAQANAWLDRNACDLIFLDIAMPGLDGLAMVARWRQAARAGAAPPPVVFVTAHAEHALRAFDLEALDYLTKPVRRERLQATLERAAQRLQAASGAQLNPITPAASLDDQPVIVVQDRGQVLRIPVSEVLYLKADLKYISVRTTEATYLLDDALSDWAHRLGSGFVRIHRNALVARRAIRALARSDGLTHALIDGPDAASATDGATWAVRVAPVDEWLAVSRRQLPVVREVLSRSQ